MCYTEPHDIFVFVSKKWLNIGSFMLFNQILTCLSLVYRPSPLSVLYTPCDFAKACKLLEFPDFRDRMKDLGYYYCHHCCYYTPYPGLGMMQWGTGRMLSVSRRAYVSRTGRHSKQTGVCAWCVMLPPCLILCSFSGSPHLLFISPS